MLATTRKGLHMPATIRRIELSETKDRLLRADEAAALLGISRRMIHRLVATGDLDKVKLGKAARFRLSDVEALMKKGAV